MNSTAGTVATVAVCTRNRAATLDGCLASLASQAIDLAAVDIVVVDNGSTDHTAAVVRGWQTHLPSLRSVREDTVGLSVARNLALDEARGPIVAFLDDDARAVPGWLVRLVDAFGAGPTAAAGGRVDLVWGDRPRWMSAELERWYSALDLGPEPRALGEDEHLVGCNFSVDRDEARAAGGFDPELGRRGDRLRSGEDWRLLDVLRARGGTVRYVPDAVVHHEVPDERARVRWLVRRAYEQGRTNALLESYCAPPQWSGAVRTGATTAREVLGDVVRWRTGVSARDALPVLVRRVMGFGNARDRAHLAAGAGRRLAG